MASSPPTRTVDRVDVIQSEQTVSEGTTTGRHRQRHALLGDSHARLVSQKETAFALLEPTTSELSYVQTVETGGSKTHERFIGLSEECSDTEKTCLYGRSTPGTILSSIKTTPAVKKKKQATDRSHTRFRKARVHSAVFDVLSKSELVSPSWKEHQEKTDLSQVTRESAPDGFPGRATLSCGDLTDASLDSLFAKFIDSDNPSEEISDRLERRNAIRLQDIEIEYSDEYVSSVDTGRTGRLVLPLKIPGLDNKAHTSSEEMSVSDKQLLLSSLQIGSGSTTPVASWNEDRTRQVEETLFLAPRANLMSDGLFLCSPSPRHFDASDSRASLRYWMTEKPAELVSKRALLFDVLQGLDRIHIRKGVHGDLRPENIVWNENKSQWMVLFPCPRRLQGPSSASLYVSTEYTAPETLGSTEIMTDLSSAIDMWSYGIIFFEIITGIPFYATIPNCSPKDLTPRLIENRINIIDDSDTRSLLSSLIIFDARSRLSAASAALSPFFTRIQKTIPAEHGQNQDVDVASKLIRFTRSTLNTPDDIIRHSVAIVSITIEEHFEPEDPFDRLGILNGQAVPMDLDRFFYPAEPIFLLHVHHLYQIRIRLQCHGVSLLPGVYVNHVKVTPPDAEGQELDVIERHISEDGFEVIALLDPSRLHSKKLCTLTPDSSFRERRFVHLLLEIKVSAEEADSTFDVFKGTLICRVVPDNVEFPMRDFKEEHEESKARLPSWMHRHLRGACFVLDKLHKAYKTIHNNGFLEVEKW